MMPPEELDRRHAANVDRMVEHNRRARLARLLDRIAEIDPSGRPMPLCVECGTGSGYRYGDEGCRHTPPGDVLAAAQVAFVERYELVFACIHAAIQLGYPAGVGFDPAVGPEWPVAYIDLPTGQVSWHMPAHLTPYDGHSTEVKYERIANYAATVTA